MAGLFIPGVGWCLAWLDGFIVVWSGAVSFQEILLSLPLLSCFAPIAIGVQMLMLTLELTT